GATCDGIGGENPGVSESGETATAGPKWTGRFNLFPSIFPSQPLGKGTAPGWRNTYGDPPGPRRGPGIAPGLPCSLRGCGASTAGSKGYQGPELAPDRVPGETGVVTRLLTSPVTHDVRLFRLDRNPDIPKSPEREDDASAPST